MEEKRQKEKGKGKEGMRDSMSVSKLLAHSLLGI